MKSRSTAKFNFQALSVWRTRCGLAALLVGSIFLSSCASERQQLRLARDAVVLFHSQLDSEQYSAIYQAASTGMKKGISEPDFVGLLQRVHQTLGAVQNSAQKGTTFQLAQGTI